MASQHSASANAESWQEKVAKKRLARQKAIPTAWALPKSVLDSLPALSEFSTTRLDLLAKDIPRLSGILTERELDITESHDVPSLLGGLASGTFTSVEVTLAFSKRAAIAHQLTNCLTETFFSQAEERARYLDDLRSNGRPLGPLHGLPISLKDTYQVEGTQACIGAVALLDKTSTENSALVDLLLDLGAVLYVKTNVSQVLMCVESDNNVFGRTLNPWNTSLTAGGSSGGEGALVAFRGSPLGVGTDLAGSVRIPSLCCGTYGFKPSSRRLPYGRQVMPLNVGIGAIVPSAGALANDMAALQIFMRAVIDANPSSYDATAIDVPWRRINESPRPKLRLGLLPEDPLFPLHPPVRETIKNAVNILKSHGHEVVLLDAADCHVAALNQIGGRLLELDQTPADIIASGVAAAAAMDDRLEQFGALQNQRAGIAESWQKIWAKHDLDAIVAPSAQSTAMEHDQHGWPAYSMFLNVLDYPACVIPFGRAIHNDTDLAADLGHGTPIYKPDAVEGAPCSIQVFTSGMRDEECLAVAAVIDTCLKTTAA
ncbi:fatty-acid amide hydrolase [Apiospora sp. TS-2023a]